MAIGKLHATTAMTGYQEALTSGVHAGAVLLFTTPHIGNVGTNTQDGGEKVQAAGVVVRERPRIRSNWRAERDLAQDLVESGTVAIAGIDTRALMHHLRRHGAMKVGIFTDETRPVGELAALVRERSAQAEPAPPSPDSSGGGPHPVGVVDFGDAGRITRALAARGKSFTTFPADVASTDLPGAHLERVILSDGPSHTHGNKELLTSLVTSDIPVLAIGRGALALAEALGGSVPPLEHPHEGANHPVRDHSTGRVLTTSHAHAHTVDVHWIEGVNVTHTSLNDGSVEGFSLADRPVSALLFPVGLGTGPTDADDLLHTFLSQEA